MPPSPAVPPIWPTAGKADSFASGGDIWAHMKAVAAARFFSEAKFFAKKPKPSQAHLGRLCGLTLA